ncbi:hypothetical protein BGZ57DRAFT_811012 [Hyaloscypha finlandica]|nr:hypothetical protein BGZ57DRAFT_811012 [Hyaloscypha finlandica]
MDLEDAEALIEHVIYHDESSASAYETGSEDESNSSHDEQASRVTRTRKRGKLVSENEEISDFGERQSATVDRASITPRVDDQVFEDAEEWASTFQAPESPGDIKDPPRRAAGSRSKRKTRTPANEVRAKRLKRYYNNDYREILNIDIEDTAAGRIQEDQYPLQESQIGSSIWTSSEKDMFFTALIRLGRDSVRDIAARIRSKSELQVQEYIQSLHQAISERRLHEGRLLAPTDMPAAIQISDECNGVLERAGDALAIRQELAEEKIEKTKWGDSWLLTKEVSRFMEKRRKEEGGEEALEEVLPAVNLFKLKHWLELSEKIFMNPAAPNEEGNWKTLAEAGETPAIRATAFTDFHSLAVNITKRLVSTTFYCTMSRLRARESNKVKHAEVSPGDVEAAVNILGLKANSNTFWIGSARRCHLQVNGEQEQEDQYMVYNDVEAALTSSIPPRSRSTSRQALSRPSSRSSAHSDLPLSSPSPLDLEISSSDSSVADYPTSAAENSDSSSISSNSSTHFHFSTRRQEAKLKKKKARKAAEKAQHAYTEAFDIRASQLEEARLWALLKQDPPFEVEEAKPLEELEMGTGTGKGKRSGGDGNWREWVGFRSPWETMESPVAEEEFERTRRISRKAKRRRVEDVEEGFGSSGKASGDESRVSEDEEEDSGVENVQLVEGSIEATDDFRHEAEAADTGSSGHTSSQQYQDDDEVRMKME